VSGSIRSLPSVSVSIPRSTTLHLPLSSISLIGPIDGTTDGPFSWKKYKNKPSQSSLSFHRSLTVRSPYSFIRTAPPTCTSYT
ncbi:hypothetical protein PENTCL1PPCAC_13364, partial [Pristionchus entomophagus]